MATSTRAKRGAKAAPVETEESAELREPTELHELMAEYFNDTYDAGVTARQCAIFTSKRNEFRSTSTYRDWRAARANGSAKSEPADKPEPVRRGRKPAAKAVADEEAPADKPRRGRPRKAAPATEEATEAAPRRRGRPPAKPKPVAAETAEETAKPARRRRSAPPAAAPVEEDTATAAPAPARRRRASRVAAEGEKSNVLPF